MQRRGGGGVESCKTFAAFKITENDDKASVLYVNEDSTEYSTVVTRWITSLDYHLITVKYTKGPWATSLI